MGSDSALGQKICTVVGSLEASRLAKGTLVLVQVEKLIISAQHTKKAQEPTECVSRELEPGWIESWASAFNSCFSYNLSKGIAQASLSWSLSIPTKYQV